MTRSSRRIVIGTVMLTVAASFPVAAVPAQQTPQEQQPDSLEALQDMLAQQQKQLDEQARQLERQQSTLDQQREDLETQKSLLLAMQTKIDQMASAGVETATDRALRERLDRLEQTVATPPDAPDVVVEDDFPGSIQVPGTNASIAFGGYVKASLVQTFDPLGSDDRFIVGSIPVEGTGEAGEGSRFSISARQSRTNMDVRRKTEFGQFRAFVEGDFAAEGDTYRLRHAFGQFRNFLMGKTWSTFVDSFATPEDIDFEGLNGRVNVRQAQWRWMPRLNLKMDLAVALEDPAPDVTGGQGVSQVPDLVARVRKQYRGTSLQGSVVFRQIRAQSDISPDVISSSFGWGASIGGRIPMRRWSDEDNFQFQVNFGDGLGRYINDLASVGGQDAAFDPATGNLVTLPVVGAYGAFQHWWKGSKRYRSTFVFGVTRVNNLDFQPGDAYHGTERATANLIWSPIPAVDVGIELLWGRRENNDSRRGTATQLQIATTYRFGN